jgi:hypothetical protein
LKEEESDIDLGEYGLGNVRTFEDYEMYAGINFKLRKVHPQLINGTNPPVTYDNLDWATVETIQKEYSFEFDLPDYEYNNLKFLYLGFKDSDDKEIYRFDVTDFTEKKIKVEFSSETQPIKYIWWPFYIETQWGTSVEKLLL